MKHILLTIIAILTLTFSTNAEIVKEGKTFKMEQTSSSKYTQTDYEWETKDGQVYPIYITNKGKFFIFKISKKTGNEYKYYLPEEAQISLTEQLNKDNK